MAYTDEDLEAARVAGYLTAEQIQAFRDFIAQSRAVVVVDEENFRLINSFNDIFVLIASVLFLGGLGWLGNKIGSAWIVGLFPTIAAWGLAEIFTRRRRMALPSIMLLLAFVSGVFYTVNTMVLDMSVGENLAEIIAASIAAFAAFAHWRRFRVPITVAAGVGALLILLFTFLELIIGELSQSLIVWFIAGLIVLAMAIWTDSHDRMRQTHYSDIAFWLHLLAAPLLVHSVFTNLFLPTAPDEATISAITTRQSVDLFLACGLYLVLTFISLALDRRALMVAAMGYVIWVGIEFLNAQTTSDAFGNFAIVGLVLGGSLLLLSAFWHQARQWILQILPFSIRAYLPN